ncbi:GNAT family N-acetyltransferase [Agromyces subbeticus]|uniref:GNAT family N-acetyltransferase n=1 Tax=Agromyces subbeticus TaxID=293890 RepID=UPI0003B6C8DA|nr:GNAT family N-acetyltransferase [Agromyces subbeticus]
MTRATTTSTTLATLAVPGGTFMLRRARRDDLPALVALIAADALRANDDSTNADDLVHYEAAFEAIDRDPAHTLVVAETAGGEVVGTMQLTLIPGLARRGAARLQVEAVRVAESTRGGGLGGAMMQWAIDDARASGAALVQLTSDARRDDAHRFYERLGFTGSHVGFKLFL